MLKHSLIALAALGAGLVGFSATQASAFTAAPQPTIQSPDNPLLLDVRSRGGGNFGGNYGGGMRNYGGNYNRHYGGNYGHYNGYRNYGYRNYGRCNPWNSNCGYGNHHNNYYGGYYGNPGWILGGIGLGYGLGYGMGYGGYYDDGYYGGGYSGGYGSRHVQWCLNRYRSYNPRSNTWVSYSGRVHQCYSPYSR